MGKSETTEDRGVIQISSSSSASSSPSEDSHSQSEDFDCSSEFSVEEISSSSCDDSEKYGDDDGGEESGGNDAEYMSRRVIDLLREGSDVEGLTLAECKAYLRRHGLRLSGTRAECVQRIKEHWRIKDGKGEILYPRSSFTMNCTGDVCKGDVVLFTQKVYRKFDKVTRSGSVLGRRTVAGRIVKESYGAAKQQHTFTVEVLWSKGIKELPPLFPLLVKGRNLYRLKTFRQSWKNDKERLEVLDEKHIRGAAARQIRDMRKTTGGKRKRDKSSFKEASKHLKPSLRSSLSEMSRRPASKQVSHHDRHGKAHAGKQRSERNGRSFGQSSFEGQPKFVPLASERRHQNHAHWPIHVESSVQYGYPRNFGPIQPQQYHQEPRSFYPWE